MAINSVGARQNLSVTRNGAHYKKTNDGKIVGAFTAVPALFLDKFLPKSVLNKPPKYPGLLCALPLLITAVGIGIGAITDKIVNNKRANQADLEQGKYRLG